MSMINANNVVNLNTVSDIDEFSLPARTPELIKSAKRIADKRICYLMQVMFEHVDDSLFEYADKAENNQVQSEYFDAMRIIRLKKEQMIKTYNHEFNKKFVMSLSDPSYNTTPNRAKVEKELDFEGLSLVEEDDLEESLAISNMVRKMLNQFKHSLYAMARRIDFVMKEVGYTSEENPFSPQVICDAFLSAVDTLELNIKIKLIVFKLFDKFVAQKVEVMYDEINSMFIAAGVLPTIKFKAPVIVRAGQQSTGAAAQGAMMDNHNMSTHPSAGNNFLPQNSVPNVAGANVIATNTPGGFVAGPDLYGSGYHQQVDVQHSNQMAGLDADPFAVIQQLLVSQRQGQVLTASQGSNFIPAQQGGNIDVGSSYVTQDVIAGLSGLQQSGVVGINCNEDQASSHVIKTNLVQEIGRIQGDSTPKSMEHTEADSIDIVSMMFDYILADNSIPDFIKSQIVLLQIPMVKVAILDKTFFAKKNHPARQLLNEMAYVADSIDDGLERTDDPIFQQIEYTVSRVLTEFESNIELFVELLSEFKLVVTEEAEANKLAEELVEQTKDTVATEIELRVQNNRIPSLIRQFLLGPWKDVLKIVGVRDECEGSAWDVSLKTMDDLIWSVQPKLIVSERQRLIKLIPNLLNALQEGLILIEFAQDSIDDLFDRLEKLHVASLRLDQITANDNATHAKTGELEPSGESNNETINESGEITIDDIIAEGSRHDAYERDLVDPALISSEYYQFVRNMELGTWLEFFIENKSKRGKLSWQCDFTGEYTFIDRKYQVVADISMRDLIKLLENNEARYIENIPVFDRAINSIVNSLKKCIDSGSNDLVVMDH